MIMELLGENKIFVDFYHTAPRAAARVRVDHA
jgi:hypothetical protein